MQEVELFFNAGDSERQENWPVYPKSLEQHELNEMSDMVFSHFEGSFNIHSLNFNEIERKMEIRKSYPDPTKLKNVSRWYYRQMKSVAIIYRFCIDGRRETSSNRMNSSVEGAYLKGVDLDKSVKKFTKRGVNIIEEIGKSLPNDIEKFLVGANFDIFKELYRRYSLNGQLGSL